MNCVRQEKRSFLQCETEIQATPVICGDVPNFSNVESIDEWIRRRLRACVWKQWRSPRTKIRKLIQMGAPKDQAIATGVSSKGYWRLSKTFATHAAMSLEWFEGKGLVSVRERWIAFHYPKE